MDNLRYQIESLLIGSKFTGEITFHQVEVNGQPFTLRLNKNDFNGRDIGIWRIFRKTGGSRYAVSDFDSLSYNQGLIGEKAQNLKKQIISAVGKDGKVNIYILYRPNQVDGYKFILRNDILTNIVPTQRAEIPGTNKKDARRFDIDLQDDDIQFKLEHIVKVASSYMDTSPHRPYPRDFLFLILKNDLGGKAAYEYDKMIGAFDRNRFYNPDEIPSSGSGSQFNYMPVKITSFEKGIAFDSSLIRQWTKLNNLLTVSTARNFPSGYRIWW